MTHPSESRGLARSSSGNGPPYIHSPPMPFRLVKSEKQVNERTVYNQLERTSTLDHKVLNRTVDDTTLVVQWSI